MSEMLAAAGLPAGADSSQLLAQVSWLHAELVMHASASLRCYIARMEEGHTQHEMCETCRCRPWSCVLRRTSCG